MPLDEEAIKLLNLCREPNTIVNLMQSLGWKNRTKFRKRYLEPLLMSKLIEMTKPDKPSSRQQQYRLTIMGEQRLADE